MPQPRGQVRVEVKRPVIRGQRGAFLTAEAFETPPIVLCENPFYQLHA